MYTWLGAQIDAMTMSYLAGAIAKVIAYANPVAMGALILWIYRYAYAAARGAVNEPALDFMMKSVRVALERVMNFGLASAGAAPSWLDEQEAVPQ